MNSIRKIVIITTLLLSITMLSTISASAKSIVLSKAKITKFQSTKPGKLSIKIKKVKKCTGYKIKISQNKNFANAKTYMIKKNNKTISGLEQGKIYYVKVRVYKKIKVNGKSKIVYSKWSEIKSATTKVNERDKEIRKEIKDKISITFSENVHFLNYTCKPYWYESYDENTGTFIRHDDTGAYIINTKLKIKESELNKIIENVGFYEQPKSSIPPGVKAGYDCDWWDLKESEIKSFYNHPHSLELTNNIVVKTVWQYIIVTREKDNNGYLTAYLVLQ